MAIVTISRGSFSHGKEVAEKVAQRLGYECISREVLLEASEHFNIPEIKLTKAIREAPSFLGRFTYGKEKYVASVEAAFLEHMIRDNVVYHGFAGHFFLKGVSHVLKVRILADLEDRIKLLAARDGCSRDKAIKYIEHIDQERRKWSLSLYGVDTFDAYLYDLVIHLRKLTIEDATEIICRTAGMEHFKTTPESQGVLNDLLIAARAKVVLRRGSYPNAEVECHQGAVVVSLLAALTEMPKVTQDVKRIIGQMEGVKEVRVSVKSPELLDL